MSVQNTHARLKIVRVVARLGISGPTYHTVLLTQGLNHGRFRSLLVIGVEGEFEGILLEMRGTSD